MKKISAMVLTLSLIGGCAFWGGEKNMDGDAAMILLDGRK